MSTNDTKLNALTSCLETLIGECKTTISSAMGEMEKFNISEKEYHKESLNLSVASFTLAFLEKAQEIAKNSGYKAAENYIRFHKHQLETKATEDEYSPINIAQNATISALSTIIALYLDK